MKIFPGKAVPIKAWVDHVQIEESAMKQLENLASMPFMYSHIAVMPDVHFGMGATVGSVIATKEALIPAAVGVDIGCGMMAVQLNLKARDLPDNLSEIRSDLEKAIPHGRTNNGGPGDRGAWHDVPNDQAQTWKDFEAEYDQICEKHPGAKAKNNANHIGTLGSGNHFVEVCIADDQSVWIMLHSGSRGLGNKIGQYFISQAKEEMVQKGISLPDVDLAYLTEGSALFDDYFHAVSFAQRFAMANRAQMMKAALAVMKHHFPQAKVTEHAVNCHHNYVQKEEMNGQQIFVTRKGAVRAGKTDLGIIPGSMGAKSFIVRGLGNVQSFCSCSHGAGRVMSRGQAKREITLEQHIEDTKGVECRKDSDVIDESPRAYKNIDDVMKSQEDLVEILYTLKQVICVKG